METQIKMRLFGSNLFTFCVFESSSDASIIISGGKSSPKLSLPKKTFLREPKFDEVGYPLKNHFTFLKRAREKINLQSFTLRNLPNQR